MTIRYSVQADTQEECVTGLERLVALDLVPVMLPTYMRDGRWMARATARPDKPADEKGAAG